MRTERRLFLYLGLFILPFAIAYPVAGHFLTGVELSGTFLLLVAGTAFAFVGAYLWSQERALHGEERPEDDADAEMSEAAGEVGTFPTASIWPFVGALGAMVIGYSLIFSTYFAVLGVALVLATIIGTARQ